MDEPSGRLTRLLNTLPISAWGIGDIRGLHPLADRYPTAISMAFGYHLDFDRNSDEAYEALLVETRVGAKLVMGAVVAELELMGMDHYAVGTVGWETLTGDFPLKTAATRAGLGWIGKNGLLVTEEFGPRVRLEAVLVDLDLPPSQPVTRSRCGGCQVCVDGCPIGCLTNAEWHAGMERMEIIDAVACAEYRKSYIPKIGRRCACGWCALTCPRGR